tara:strand:- start:106 stop:465 length:360 start_codon:yes stop_codon:yes gene_type:complete
MTDHAGEERNNKIRNQWIEKIDQDEEIFAREMNDPEIPFHRFLELQELSKNGQELKVSIEDGYTPAEPPVRGYKPVDGKVVQMTENKSQPRKEIRKHGVDIVIARICKFFPWKSKGGIK